MVNTIPFLPRSDASGGRVVSAPDFGSRSGRFNPHRRQNSAHECSITQSLIITLPSSQYDSDDDEKDVKHQILYNLFITWFVITQFWI